MDDRTATSLHTGFLIAVIGIFAWATGLPALFPSLGPSAFVLAMFPESDASNARRVVGSHVIGVVAGFATYHLFATGIVLTNQIAPFSITGLKLAISSVSAIVFTVLGMLYFSVRHPPACATTLIIALGLLPTVSDSILIVAAVVVLVMIQETVLLNDHLTERVTRFMPEYSRPK